MPFLEVDDMLVVAIEANCHINTSGRPGSSKSAASGGFYGDCTHSTQIPSIECIRFKTSGSGLPMSSPTADSKTTHLMRTEAL